MKFLPTASAIAILQQGLTTTTLVLLGALAVSACSSAPKTPDWQLEARGSMDRSIAAYLEGNNRVDLSELARARKQLSSTGRVDLMAAAELLHCAAEVASLVLMPCTGFEALRQDATDAQRAYADYLRGQVAPSAIPLLPVPQHAAAVRSASDGSALQGIDDPLSLLVAAGVLLEAGKANPAVIEQAVTTASSQGWRRPLMAWLGVQIQRARQTGQIEEADRLTRRIQLIQGVTGLSR